MRHIHGGKAFTLAQIRPVAPLLAAALLALVPIGTSGCSQAAPANTQLAASQPAETSAPAAAEPTDLMSEFLGNPMSFFFDLRSKEALTCGQAILANPSLAADNQREEALVALGAIYVANSRPREAETAFTILLEENPSFDLKSPELLPPLVVDEFYKIKSRNILASDAPAELDIRTLAVGDIENNSIVSGKYNLDKFARGLTQIIITDLNEATPLTIVDRQRLQVIREEIALSNNNDISDPEYRVPFGKLTGAQSFLFGSIIQAEKDRVRLDLRWVDTSTGEVLLAEGVESKLKSSNDLFKLEQKVLLDMLLPQIAAMLDGENAKDLKNAAKPYLEEKKRLKKDDAYVQLLLKTGEAMIAEENGDYAAAQAAWEEASMLNPADQRHA
ncbi:MAG: hypothetical protein HKN21_00655, partial [Candidatus Eisenbacteria bacterium]|nr:hypothetical protein [Candidatus Eisenbacteria bacterium]